MNPTKIITTAGLAILADAANGNGSVEWTHVRTGDGVLGATDPTTLQDLISIKQEFDAIDVKKDSLGVPFIFTMLSNAGLAAQYLRREIGLYGRLAGTQDEVLMIYLYAATDADADTIPVPAEGVATPESLRVQVAQSADLTATVTVDQYTVYLSLDRWDQHLSGAGGVDQHPTATNAAPGLMAAADKSKIDAHINTDTPSGGSGIHALATAAAAGFMPATDKDKLDHIQAGAEVNQNAFAVVRVGATNIQADAKTDVLTISGGTYIALTPNEANDSIAIEAQNIAPASHIGSNGASHAAASQAAAGFMSASDKTLLDKLVPYYAYKAAWGYGGILSNLNATATLCGIKLAPKGGIHYFASWPWAILEMRVNNAFGATLNQAIFVARIDGQLYYQVDAGAITSVANGPANNVSFQVSIPVGVHTVRWYVLGEGSQLAIADWLSVNCKWEPGGLYY